MSNNKTTNVIPFGKYKGQPVEALAQDRQYADWLMAQPWFRERYQNFYTIIVNNFTEPSETPEHNAMQAEFLNDDFRQAFLLAIGFAQTQLNLTSHAMTAMAWHERNGKEKDILNKARKEECIKANMPHPKTHIGFEYKGWDVALSANWTFWADCEQDYFIEIKPTLADDYPAVLRQMTAAKRAMNDARTEFQENSDPANSGYDNEGILLVGVLSARGATLDQVREIFKLAGFRLIMRSEIPIPSIELPF